VFNANYFPKIYFPGRYFPPSRPYSSSSSSLSSSSSSFSRSSSSSSSFSFSSSSSRSSSSSSSFSYSSSSSYSFSSSSKSSSSSSSSYNSLVSYSSSSSSRSFSSSSSSSFSYSSSSSFSFSSSSKSSSSTSNSSSSSASSSSESSSSSSVLPGTIVWGQETGITEDYSKPFVGNWETVNASILGSGDAEYVELGCPASEFISETHYLGTMNAIIDVNAYQAGSGEPPILMYKTGTTRVSCDADVWHIYNGISFPCLGWMKIRVLKP